MTRPARWTLLIGLGSLACVAVDVALLRGNPFNR